eukprot:scaffold67328_cov41-Cyclotella_meneghiniana.AAC.6
MSAREEREAFSFSVGHCATSCSGLWEVVSPLYTGPPCKGVRLCGVVMSGCARCRDACIAAAAGRTDSLLCIMD